MRRGMRIFRNMIYWAASAEAAVVVIAADEGSRGKAGDMAALSLLAFRN